MDFILRDFSEIDQIIILTSVTKKSKIKRWIYSLCKKYNRFDNMKYFNFWNFLFFYCAHFSGMTEVPISHRRAFNTKTTPIHYTITTRVCAISIYFYWTSVDTKMCCPKGKCGCQYFILLSLKKKIMDTGVLDFFNKKLILDYYFCLKSGPLFLFQLFIIAPSPSQGI